jgi:hypothetical protein
MLEQAKLKAFQIKQEHKDNAIEHVKKLLSLAYETLEINPTIENSHNFNYWGDVMDELYNLEP